jgi:hypothetical protein
MNSGTLNANGTLILSFWPCKPAAGADRVRATPDGRVLLLLLLLLLPPPAVLLNCASSKPGRIRGLTAKHICSGTAVTAELACIFSGTAVTAELDGDDT